MKTLAVKALQERSW